MIQFNNTVNIKKVSSPSMIAAIFKRTCRPSQFLLKKLDQNNTLWAYRRSNVYRLETKYLLKKLTKFN